MKIYTKTGDKGETSLIGGVRVLKSNVRIEAYGCIDELNSWMGVIRNVKEVRNLLCIQNIQNTLFVIGSHLASHPEKGKMKLPHITNGDIEILEKEIDEMESELKPLMTFVLPGSSQENSFCHVARTVCRRAERRAVELASTEAVDEIIIRYLNRLSDYLFVLSRHITSVQSGVDIPWKP